MANSSEFRYYKVEGMSLELLKSYADELKAFADGRKQLAEEFDERAERQAGYHRANLRALWYRLSASVGLDPKKTWGNPEYQIETRYLKDGFGALLYAPQPPNPFQGEIAGPPEAPRQDPESDIPDESETRH